MDQIEIITIIKKKNHKFDLKDKIERHKNYNKQKKEKKIQIKSRITELKYLIYTI